MLLTATCSYNNIEEIRSKLNIPENNFTIIRGASFQRNELAFEIRKRKENKQIFWRELANYINEISDERCIIYCATKNKCEELQIGLENLVENSIGLYHGGLNDNTRQQILKSWKLGVSKIMIGTSAFGMGINCINVRCIIFVNAPINMSKYLIL